MAPSMIAALLPAKRRRRFPLAVMPVMAVAAFVGATQPARAQLTLSINNHTCATLTVGLADAPGCGPGVAGCFAEARNGFTTKLTTYQPHREGYLRLSARGECRGARNATIIGDCLVQIKTVWKRAPGFGITVYRDHSALPEGQSAGPPYDSPYVDLDLMLPQPASLVTIDIYQGICDNVGGERRCEMFCRVSDQQ